MAGLTALRCVRLGGALVGRRVLITGAAGGVGTLAVQIAAASGAHVTAVVGRPERGASLKALGAHDVVHGIENAIGRFSLILESGGGDLLHQAAAAYRRQRDLSRFTATPPVIRRRSGFADFLRGAKRADSASFFYFTSGTEEMFAPDMALLVSLVASGQLRPEIGIERDWSEFAAVAEMLRSRQVSGKAVFRTGGA